MIKKIKKYLSNPRLIIIYLMNKGLFNFLPDKIYLKWKYKLYLGKKLDLDNPKTFNEKLQWLKLYDRNPLYTNLVDKYEVRKYVADKIGEEYLIPLIGVYDKFEDIDFDKLPNQFVIKCTHDSGSVVICKDKSTFDIKKCKKKIKKALKYNYFYYGREWPYKNVKPRIIIEKYISDLENNTIDYKFLVFNGKFKFLEICSNRFISTRFTFYDKDLNFIDVTQDGCEYDCNIIKTAEYSKMIELAEKLSQDIIEVRVDFYYINSKTYFGELTFFEDAGFGKYEPEIWDEKFGEMLKLPIEENDN